jgi:hypothetical protein
MRWTFSTASLAFEFMGECIRGRSLIGNIYAFWLPTNPTYAENPGPIVSVRNGCRMLEEGLGHSQVLATVALQPIASSSSSVLLVDLAT